MPANPAPIADERSQLLEFLRQQRDGRPLRSFGLTDAQAAATNRDELAECRRPREARRPRRTGLDGHGAAAAGRRCHRLRRLRRELPVRPDDSIAVALQSLDEAAAETEAVLLEIDDLNQAVPVPKGVPWFPQDVEAWSVRWVLLHLIEETARHAGHADIVRESVDGATSVELMAGAEGWPESDWVKPWKPAD